MRVQQLEAFGLAHLCESRRETPEPGPHQVLIRVHAASLNYRDHLVVQGSYNPRQRLPLVPCSDGAGEVVALGPGVEGLEIGARVCPIFAQAWLGGAPTRERVRSTLGSPLDGTLAEYMLVSAQGLVSIPEHLSWEEAACLPCAAVTAWNALALLPPGSTVLLLGTGGVSLFALQFARLRGLRCCLTSSSSDKLERALALGAERGINYRQEPEWGAVAREWSGGEGVDLVVEVGGAGTLEQSLKAVRLGGQISMIGVLSGVRSQLSLLPIVMGQVRLQGILVGSRDDFLAMNRAISASRLRPVVDRVYAFEETRAAFEHLASGTHFGKVCIRV